MPSHAHAFQELGAPRRLRSVNPANGMEIRSYPVLDPFTIERRIERSAQSFESFRRKSLAERAAVLVRAARILEEERARWGELMALEMGKLKTAGEDEALKCARACLYYAENAGRFLADRIGPTTADGRSFVAYQPLGPLLAVMPWNFPFWQVLRFAAPALMAGNTVLLKHSSNVPQCALAVEEILRRAGLPEGVFQTLLIGSEDVPRLIDDSRVVAVTLTGSEKAGSEVAAAAGRNLKKAVLELGGSDPFIVMPGADLEVAVRNAVEARTLNNGQSCVASKRFIVHETVAEEFERRFAAAMGELVVGDPLDPRTQLGPLATEALRAVLARQVDETVRLGARALTGGRPLERPGFYYAPTVLASIPHGAPAWNEEFFGPVALVFRASGIEDAVRLANDNPFGLGASLWGADPREQEYFVREIAAGMAFVNARVASDPSLPFGGVKRSGHGRELGEEGIREFVNVKTVKISDRAADREG